MIGALVGWVSLGGVARAIFVPQPQPPVASSLPTHEQELLQNDLAMPAAESMSVLQDREPPTVLQGRVLDVDTRNGLLSLDTTSGPRTIAVPAHGTLIVDRRTVNSPADLPRAGTWQVRVIGVGDGATLEMRSLDQASGPDATPPVPTSETIPP
jgi:hypothetical protein